MNKFKNAINGICDGLKHKSVLTQFILAIITILAGVIFKLNSNEWLVVLVLIVIVITAEMLNTAIEKTCDLISKEKNEEIKVIKDISAGAVLVSSMGALFCAIIILFNHYGG